MDQNIYSHSQWVYNKVGKQPVNYTTAKQVQFPEYDRWNLEINTDVKFMVKRRTRLTEYL